MNETENQNTPVEEEVLGIDMSDFDDDITSSEDTEQPADGEVSTPAETTEEEVDFTPLLNRLSKDIKYMDEDIAIDDYDNVKTNYQKGLDYDKKVEKLKEIENGDEMTFVREKAKEQGLTSSEYISKLRNDEIVLVKQQEENELNEMIENGVAEHIARKVIDTNKVAMRLDREDAKRAEQAKEVQLKEAKEADTNMFLEAYPDVNIKDIPQEVFKDAEKSNLLTAYTKHQNTQLLKQIETLKQNKTNEATSPVKTTTEHGGVVVEKEDPFLKGLGF